MSLTLLLWAFQSTRPVRGGTIVLVVGLIIKIFQSTRPVRGGTTTLPTRSYPICISIHPPRAGRDPRTPPRTLTTNYFNPPAPCGAGLIQNVNGLFIPLFQSTRPVRGGTKSIIRRACSSSISIHPPHAGRDHKVEYDSEWVESFQSTRPVRGGTRWMT